MKTQVVKITHTDIDQTCFQCCKEILRAGGLVAFPTETVYGLGANALDAEASEKIYAAKGRPSDNPLIVHISDPEQLAPLVLHISEQAQKLMDAFWPGPLTLVFPKSDLVPKKTTGGLDTVAIRMPDHPVALAMIRAAGLPIAAPSANLSGRPSPTSAKHVIEDMNGRIDMIIDDGDVGIGVESTIVDLTGDQPMILRPGFISEEMIKTVLKAPVSYDPAILRGVMIGEKTGGMSEGLAPKAPGMKYRHYAPKAPLCLVRGEKEKVAQYIIEEIRKNEKNKVGVLCTDETKALYDQALTVSIGPWGDAKAVAHNLYARLREFDDTDVTMIYSECFGLEKDTNLLAAIDNRLGKAAGGQVVIVS